MSAWFCLYHLLGFVTSLSGIVFSVMWCFYTDAVVVGYAVDYFVPKQAFLWLSEWFSLMYLLQRAGCCRDVDRLRLWDRTYCVCTNTALPVWEEVPSDRAHQPRHSHRLFTLAGSPPSTPFHPFSSLLFNNPGNLNRWKRVSEPAASTQIEVLSCMVIRPSHENGSVLFSPEPQLPSSSSWQRLVWTPVESTAKISVALRKGRVSG